MEELDERPFSLWLGGGWAGIPRPWSMGDSSQCVLMLVGLQGRWFALGWAMLFSTDDACLPTKPFCFRCALLSWVRMGNVRNARWGSLGLGDSSRCNPVHAMPIEWKIAGALCGRVKLSARRGAS